METYKSSVFRTFSSDEFYVTDSWLRLEAILRGNGGCYGLYGPRGVGKSWLMLNAIDEANGIGGMGLWFPSPSEYDATAFLSALSDNLANEIERRLVRNSTYIQILNRSKIVLLASVAIPLAIAILTLILRGITTTRITNTTLIDLLPGFVWATIGIAAYTLVGVYLLQFLRENRPHGRLVREATALRERIRFTTSLKLGSEFGIDGGKPLKGTFKRKHEKALSERPATIASLIFDFRNLAGRTAETLPGPVVVGIDELDKIENVDSVRGLLRDIKGIFEIAGVHFLVSVSEEAASALQIGAIQAEGRNEFNSSFYTVLEVPPLAPAEARELLQKRGMDVDIESANALCLLAAGNQRELIRLADAATSRSTHSIEARTSKLVLSTLKDETFSFLVDSIKTSPVDATSGMEHETKIGMWNSLPRDSFETVDKFILFGKTAIRSNWTPEWRGESWGLVREPWRRMLIRLFVIASALEKRDQSQMLLSDEKILLDLVSMLIMATHDSGVARLVLESAFGADLSGPYSPGVISAQKGFLLRFRGRFSKHSP